jgi:protein-disulfide isomerase
LSGQSGRRPRLVGVIALAASALVLLFVIASLSLDEGDEGPIEITGQGDVQQQLGGIRQQEERLGEPGAPITVQVFSDLQCTPCTDFQREVVSPLIEGPVRAGEVKLEFHHFPMTRAGFGLASYGAVAAAKQHHQWQFIQLFFANQGEAERRGVSEEFLDRVAGAILEFNVEQWQRDLDDPDLLEALEADDELRAELGFPAEPALVVSGPRGSRELIQSPSLEQVNDAIAQIR